MNHNPYRAYWEKSQEASLKLAQYYTPECLVDLCLELLQPKGELFDPCCGLGGFLLKAKSNDAELKISGNDIAKDLGTLPFDFTNTDYLQAPDQPFDYIIANIPFNSKKTHTVFTKTPQGDLKSSLCDLYDENYCWINKIIANTRKKALIILPSGVNSGLNKRITEKRIEIINSGVLELVCQLPSHLFNQTNIAPTVWLIDKQKTEQGVYFLNAEKYSEWQNKKRFLTEENIKDIGDKNNWLKADLTKIEENNYCLAPNRYEPLEQNELKKWEINQQLIKHTYELRASLHMLIADAYNKLMMLEELDDEGQIKLASCFMEGQKVEKLQEKIKELMVEKYFKNG